MAGAATPRLFRGALRRRLFDGWRGDAWAESVSRRDVE
jgi:hypothetical protein